MDPLYNLGVNVYRFGVRVAALRNRKARLMIQGHSRGFDLLRRRLDPAGGYIWIHASSLGEFEQGRPLIEMIKAENPSARIILTFFSPSGYEVRKNYDKVDLVCYLPFDLPHLVHRFLDIVKPSVAIFVKYEFWGNYMMELRRRRVPTYIISAIFRPGQSFFRPWGGMFRKILRCYTKIMVQDELSAQLLSGIGFTNVLVTGDTRFDRVADICRSPKQIPAVERFVQNSEFTLVLGSSWPPDEDLVIPYFNSHPKMKLLIAPHEFDHDRLLALLSRLSRPAEVLSQTTPEQAAKLDCIVVDSFGVLSSLYRYGHAAYVGGGFGAGIHNINEPAVFSIPVVFGPNHAKFREATDLQACGGAFAVKDGQEFTSVLDRLCDDSDFRRAAGHNAGAYIQAHLGATRLNYDAIFNNHQS